MKAKLLLLSAIALMSVQNMDAQTYETLKYGNFDSWVVRVIKESKIIGGKVRTLYEVGPADTIKGNIAYTNKGGSPWGTSNVLAKVSGITKTNTTVMPERRGNGYCAKLETTRQVVNALGIKIKVLAAGSVFLGETLEPITGTSNPMAKINAGVPFTKTPKALVFDYKVHLTDEPNRIYESTSKLREVPGKDMADVVLVMQKRWEDEKGQIHAQRVATMMKRFDQTTPNWVNDARFEIHYGDITGKPFYQPHMGLITGEDTRYARNSKGKMVKILEEGWAPEGTQPTHLILQFDSSYGGAYTGTIGTTMWIDNVRFEY